MMTLHLADIPVRFDEPSWLWLTLLLAPIIMLTGRSLRGPARLKPVITLVLRIILMLLCIVSLAHPHLPREGEGLTVTLLIDRSRSIPLASKQFALEYLRRATEEKDDPADRLAVLTIGRDAGITAMPDALSRLDVITDPPRMDATNLAAGLRLAMAVMPEDTANRIVLISDGNENIDSVLGVADLALAMGVPIDVLPLEYEHPHEVLFEDLVVPPRGRIGQTVNARMVMRSRSEVTGSIRMLLNGEVVDLNGDAPGTLRPIRLTPGINSFDHLVSLDRKGPNEFRAQFLPDDPAMDAVMENNTGAGVSFVAGEGRVLILDEDGNQSLFLVSALRDAGVGVDVLRPEEWGGNLTLLSGYDTVILANIPRWSLDGAQDEMLHVFVHDLGGGLIMLGGDESFGAGGWIDTEVARTLPVEMNPPHTREMPAGALALIMHSCEMPRGNFWGKKVAESAIGTLSRLDYVGIVEYDWGGGGAGAIEGCAWTHPMQRVGDKQAAIAAARTLTLGDMQSFTPSMELALQGLTSVPAAQRHVIIISDGDPSPPTMELLDRYVENRVTVSTVMVGGHGTANDRNRMQVVASRTGGQFHNVTDPTKLPQIFIKEAQLVARSLIQEIPGMQPVVTSFLPGPAQGFHSVPPVDGYVLTAMREGLAQSPIIIPVEDAEDPLFAFWNYGIGRSVAFTSDVTSRWGSSWASWDMVGAFWEQVVRWSMRPSAPTNYLIRTHRDGDLVVVELEALDVDASFLNFLHTSAVVVHPDADPRTLSLQQVGPGLYRGEFRVDAAGSYLLNIMHERTVDSGIEKGSVQAAVNVAYEDEYRDVTHNAALLRVLADRTGGRILDPAHPETASLFDRNGLTMPSSPRPIWDLLAILAAILLVLDIAARRLAWDSIDMQEAADRAFSRRGEVGTRALAAYRRVKEGARDQSRIERSRLDGDAPGLPEPELESEVETPDAGEAGVTPPEPEEGEDAGDAGDNHTGRLLRARRKRMEDRDDH